MEPVENKKHNLEELSREDLVKKCKNLIALAQKAKTAKESLQEENHNLKIQLKQCNQNDASNEVLERLTEEKLLLVTQIDEMKLKNKKLEDTIKEYEGESSLLKDKITGLETENTSYARQVKRLTDENEQLISDLSTLETQIAELHNLGIQQKSQLLILEKSSAVSLDDIQKLNSTVKIKEQEIINLSNELEALKIIKSTSLEDSNKNCDNYIKELNELRLKNESYSKQMLDIQSVNEKLKEKVTLYHTKLKKFALTTKEIKEEKNQILIIFKDYTNQIKQWKEQLHDASEQVIKLVHDLRTKYEKLKIENGKECVECNDIKATLNIYANQLENFKENEDKSFTNKLQRVIHIHNNQIEELNTKIHQCKIELDKSNGELNLKDTLLEKATETIKLAEYENNKLSDTLKVFEEKLNNVNSETTEKLKEENETLNKELITCKEEINRLNQSLKESTNTEKKLAEKSSEEILRLAESNKNLEQKYSDILRQLSTINNKSLEHSFSQTSDELVSKNSFEENGIDLKRENSEMLLEMNQMNQAIKERGETISKLEAHCEEIKKRLQLYETQANKNVDSISEKEETIKALSKELDSLKNGNQNVSNENESSKDIEITNLKAEIESLKERCNTTMDLSYAESETMSTSTISRSEEHNRLKDLDGSWEERYGKLRTLAVKLKAKIRDQTNHISDLEKEKDELLKKQSNALKSIQSFQAQIDKLQDDLEKANSENKHYLAKLNSVAENISKDKQLLVSNEEMISNLNKENEKLREGKQAVENWKKQVSAKIQTLRKELEAKNLLIKDFENKVSKLEGDFKSEQENHKQTKNILDQTNTECKKNSVLNLEMQDYERSVKELSQKVEKQKTEISNFQTQLDTQKNTVNALREQNKILEERIQEEEKNGNSSSLEVTACKKNIANLEEIVQYKEEKILDMTKLLETTRSENEELSTELSKVIAEHQKSLNVIKTERDQLRSQILGLQQNLRDTQDTLKLREDELNLIKDDYETYKVRAQSVLKKNQHRDLGLEEKLSEELTTIKSRNGKLSDEVEVLREELEKQQITNNKIIHERNTLTKKTTELEEEVEDLKGYSEQLALKHQKALSEHAETVRNLKVHAETLSQCYRQQLSEQEVRHNREIIELQSRIDKAPSPVDTGPLHPSMPREEGEGSESIESNPLPNTVHPIPLERLLDSKTDNEVAYLKKSLSEQESKVVHLTALLSDTEQDLAKHVQMNKVLKEEIRRQQRSVEREKHAENLEYLKNVVFKFVTLNSGDERTRLVPVLNTILKLSPEETHKLSMVAKGDPGIKAWASYWPTWSSPSKPQ